MSVLSRVQRGFGYGALAVATFGIIASGVTDTAVNPSTGNISLVGYGPTIVQTANQSVSPGAGSISLVGYAPAITQTVNQSVDPSAGTFTLTGYAPTITQIANQEVSPIAGSFALVGYAPDVVQSVTGTFLYPLAAGFSLIGYTPDVAQTAHQSASPGVGSFTLTGYAPDISQASTQTEQNSGGFIDYGENKRIHAGKEALLATAKKVIKNAKKRDPDAFEEAIDVIAEIRAEIENLGIKAEYYERINKQQAMIQAQLAKEQLEAQIEEIDVVFGILIMLAQLD
jgi:hypothetical protein